MDSITAGLIATAVKDSLNGADLIAMVPSPTHSIVREGYWEHAWIVTWQRELRNGQPDKSGDGMTYATHRVHVNSNGDSACFDGHYDQERREALIDMFDRASIGPTDEVERLRGEWRKADDGWIAAKEEIDRLHKSLELSVCYSPGAIRDSFDGADEDHPDAKWAREATDEQLLEVSHSIIGSDPTWKDFHRNIELGIEHMRSKEGGIDA
jgi:hypothetical protein